MKKLLAVSIILLFFGMIIFPSSGIQIDKNIIIPTSRGNTLYVGGNGSGNYTKIQDAIDHASDGDAVFVYDDSSPYYEYLTIKKSINLVGEDRETTIIDAERQWFVIEVMADYVNISGFTLRNGHFDYGIIGVGDCDCVTITDNNIIKDHVEAALWFLYSDGNTITNNNITSKYWSSGGIFLDLCRNNIISDNIISNCEYGIIQCGRNGNIITGNHIINNLNGIRLYWGCHDNIISDNYISNNNYGIFIDDSRKNTISGNSFVNNGIYVYYINTDKNIIVNNTVNGKPLVYLENESDTIIDVDAGQVILVNCENITIQNQDISNADVGIELCNTNNCLISDNTITSNNKYGIVLLTSISNIFTDNDISNNENGLRLSSSNNNNINGNNIALNSDYGLNLKSSSNNNITGNNISTNEYGIYLIGSSINNTIYHNNFINNTQNAFDKCDNIWDDGKYGNYWSDYEKIYPDAKPRILKPWMWNTPYEIPGDGNNNDTCPLVKQWSKSKSKDIPNDKSTSNSLQQKFLDKFPLLEVILSKIINL